MMDDNDLTGESLIFVDFDLTQYGFRAFDWIYHLKSASHKLFVQTDGEEYFISDEDLDKWLQIYRNNLGGVNSLCGWRSRLGCRQRALVSICNLSKLIHPMPNLINFGKNSMFTCHTSLWNNRCGNTVMEKIQSMI